MDAQTRLTPGSIAWDKLSDRVGEYVAVEHGLVISNRNTDRVLQALYELGYEIHRA